MIRSKMFERVDEFNDWLDENVLKVKSIIVTYEDGQEKQPEATRCD